MGLIFLDFDGTITQHDTLNALVSLALTHRNPHGPNQELLARWRAIVRDYVADHAAHLAAYSPPPHLRRTLAQELDFLESLGPVEGRSVARVSRAGLFAGLRGGDLEGLGRGAVSSSCSASSGQGSSGGGGGGGGGGGSGDEGVVKLRKGFGLFVERMGGGRGWDIGVVSVNWSGRFIKGVVESGYPQSEHGGKAFELMEERIVANGIAFPDGEIEGPEELGGQPLLTAGDKLRALKSLRERMAEERVVYFGDSTTDLACLIEADFGVVMAEDEEESKLLRTLKRVGCEVPHVDQWRVGGELAWARDFEEVLRSGVMERIA
ncbi:hypothetical protein MMYC01_206498 [Madurella mycetomatis]|uniref:Uncharacterized protein n=1 Tax=Madurella mycetomatis TaxID=100816 RepID=A0A175W490_9PEZI|nr:hypothetical protein MMYC01_206498 [Madurella mycetomatis]